jgi:hypothetical protein
MELSEFQAAVATVRRGCAGGVELAAERARAEAALSNSAAVAAKLQASAERYAHLYQEFIKLKERFAKQGKELSQLKEVRRLLATLSPGPHVAGAEPPRALAPVSLASTKPCNPDPAPAPSSARRQRKPGNRPTVVLHAEHGRGADAELELTQPVDAPIPQREPDAVAPPQQPSPGHLSQAGGSKHTMPKAQGGELQRRPCAPRSPTPTPQSPGAAGADRKAPSLVRAMEAGRKQSGTSTPAPTGTASWWHIRFSGATGATTIAISAFMMPRHSASFTTSCSSVCIVTAQTDRWRARRTSASLNSCTCRATGAATCSARCR